ncbi:DNA repair exonuclease [Pelagicoccus sp. NFK12]|uniref:DNA repair exonuclease n=1 Tax=Pelagicoccus enzymogenes TaxID=2773457 RepID=A0A927FD94_9BACT|nr:DNA repair exonuclease [Pelagicoccus enzymogenes]MBD5781656.1 DNA repair exonuclease [Pelagicoccus enzymogenes]
MIRFIHTADWQMGMKASGLGAASQAVRDARLDSLKSLVDIGHDKNAELLLVTGDLFEDNAVDRLLVRRVGDLLATFNGKVFITPGNHDPLVPGSVWDHPVWQESKNVTVIREANPIELDDCTLYPCPLKEKYSTRNPTSWIDAAHSDRIAIGMAHGTVEGMPGMEPDYPIPRDAATRAGLDYLGIGHWHSFATYPDSKGETRMAYSGTHETTKFGERDSGNVLLVEIESRGARPKIESIPCGQLSWHSLDIALDREGAVEDAIETLDKIDAPAKALVRLRLDGMLYASDRAKLAVVEELLASRFLYGSLSIEKLVPAPEDDSWIESLPAGPIREAAEKIRHQALNASDDFQKSIATQALIELFELKEQAAL